MGDTHFWAGKDIASELWPQFAGRLAGLIVLLLLGLFPTFSGLIWWERKLSRHDRLSNQPVFLMVMNLLFLVGLVTLPTLGWRTGLLLWGETAVAQIQTVDSTRSYDEDAGWLDRYTITYAFEPKPGRSIEREAKINQAYFVELTPNDDIEVTFFPILPRTSQPSQNLLDDDYAAYFLAAIIAFYLLIIGARFGGQKLFEIVDERF
jgi:hypothetical protein